MPMLELKNTVQNKILRKLALHHAVAEGKLFDMITEHDSEDSKVEYQQAIAKLYHKGLIDVVKDPSNTMHIIRMKVEYQ